MKKKITFYYTDDHEFHLCKILSCFAKKNKFNYKFSNNLNEESDIGFYCQDSNAIKKVNSKFSIITLGGLDQGKLVWPNLWSKEPWNKFDIGFLPGKSWKKKWLQSSWDACSRPKLSMNVIGWPKTEKIFIKKNKKKVPFNKNKTIIYAPNREMDNKAIEVIKAIKELNLNLIIKQFGWSQPNQKAKFKDLRKNINIANKFAKKTLKNHVYIVNPKENIMNYYNQANLLITDESSVVYEALLFDLPSLSFIDWKMSQNNKDITRTPIIDKTVCFTCLRKDMKFKILNILKNYNYYKKKIIKKKFYHFSYIDKSCQNFYKLIDSAINSKKNCFEIKPIYKINYIINFQKNILMSFKLLKKEIKKFLL